MISTTVSSIAYSGNNSTTTAYSIPFPFLANADISVSITNAAGTVTPLVYGTDYAVTNNVDSDGRITDGEMKTIAAYDSTNTVTLKRNTSTLQELNLVEGGKLSAEPLESALDRVTMLVQEAIRDTSHNGESNVTAAGTGLIAQTSADIFAARSITPAANSGLAIANGDGVAGNPTIDLDATTLGVITTVADADKVRVETSNGSEIITVANLLSRSWPSYKYKDISVQDFRVSGGASGVSIADGYLKFTGSATGSTQAFFTVPEDYAGGEISVKLHAYLSGGTNGDPFVMQVYAYADNGAAIGSLMNSVAEATLTHNSADCVSDEFSLGSGYTAGQHYRLFISRDSADALDTSSSLTANIKSVRLEYSAGRVTTSW